MLLHLADEVQAHHVAFGNARNGIGYSLFDLGERYSPCHVHFDVVQGALRGRKKVRRTRFGVVEDDATPSCFVKAAPFGRARIASKSAAGKSHGGVGMEVSECKIVYLFLVDCGTQDHFLSRVGTRGGQRTVEKKDVRLGFMTGEGGDHAILHTEARRVNGHLIKGKHAIRPRRNAVEIFGQLYAVQSTDIVISLNINEA